MRINMPTHLEIELEDIERESLYNAKDVIHNLIMVMKENKTDTFTYEDYDGENVKDVKQLIELEKND